MISFITTKSKSRKYFSLLTYLLFLANSFSTALADGQASTNFTVTAYYTNSCALTLTINNPDTFQYAGDQINVTQTGYISVCDTNSYSIAASISSLVAGVRKMVGPGGNTLDYNLYDNIGNVWGDGNSGTTVIHESAATANTTVAFNYSIMIPGNQVPLAGSYSDTIIVTATTN
jgi:spore coat protein U-like protein